MQSNSITRELVSNYPYDSKNDKEFLHENTNKISDELLSMLQKGLNITETKIIKAIILCFYILHIYLKLHK